MMGLRHFGADSIKELVAFANERELQREDIVAILPQESGTYTMIYFDVD